MRTVTDQVIPLDMAVEVTVNVAGVWSTFRCYINPQPCTYSILLSRRWLYQTQAQGDYRREKYWIHCEKGQKSEVQRDPTMEGTPLNEPVSVFRLEEIPTAEMDDAFRTELEK